VGPPGRATLEIGCGEGRVARDLRDRGHRVIAVDASPTLIALAHETDPDGEYVVADAAALPFADASFDLVVAHNSLMDFDDLAGSVAEAARVLEPTGRFAIAVVHPLSDAGRWESRDPEARFVVSGSYFERRQLRERFERDGLEITFHGWVRPLEDYVRALELAGFVILRMREPALPAGRWVRLAEFLHVLAVRR
jgi:SAM-dependent methyltransferase